MDLAHLDAVAVDLLSATMRVKDPNTDAYLFTLVLAGIDHPRVREFAAREKRRLALQVKRQGNLARATAERVAERLTEAAEGEDVQQEVDALLLRTLGWEDMTKGGAPLPYDEKLMTQLYTSRRWLREQVTAFLVDNENFIGSSSTASSLTSSTS